MKAYGMRMKTKTRAFSLVEMIIVVVIIGILAGAVTLSFQGRTQDARYNLALSDITGYVTTFKVHELLGATRERQESGLKQWFGWYDRKYNRFVERQEQGLEEVDALLDQFEPRSEKERREFEKYRAERDG